MPLVANVDGPNRNIHLSIETVDASFHPVDIYKELRTLRRTDESLRKYNNFMRGDGNVSKGGGKATERYFTLLEGARIVPYDSDHTITVIGTIITDDGQEGVACFDKTAIASSVDIQYTPQQVEVINLNFDDLVYSSFQGAVWIDVNSSYDDEGTANFPNGNVERPVNNAQLAVTIAADKGFNELRFVSNYTLDIGDIVDNYTLHGINPTQTTLTINAGASTQGCEIHSASVTGTLDGATTLRDCVATDINYINGVVHDTMLNPGTIYLGGSQSAFFINCFSGVPGTDTPTLDMNGLSNTEDTPLALRGYIGGIKLIDMNSGANVSLDIMPGQIKIDLTTCTNGTLVCRGVGKVIDTNDNLLPSGIYNSNLTLINETVYGIQVDEIWNAVQTGTDPAAIADAVWSSTIAYANSEKGKLLEEAKNKAALAANLSA